MSDPGIERASRTLESAKLAIILADNAVPPPGDPADSLIADALAEILHAQAALRATAPDTVTARRLIQDAHRHLAEAHTRLEATPKGASAAKSLWDAKQHVTGAQDALAGMS